MQKLQRSPTRLWGSRKATPICPRLFWRRHVYPRVSSCDPILLQHRQHAVYLHKPRIFILFQYGDTIIVMVTMDENKKRSKSCTQRQLPSPLVDTTVWGRGIKLLTQPFRGKTAYRASPTGFCDSKLTTKSHRSLYQGWWESVDVQYVAV
jgi:hypothetical protein